MKKYTIIENEENENKEIAKILGQNIRKFREAKKITRMEFSIAMDVTESTVCKWENGDSCPRLALFEKICRYFKVTPNELFGYDNMPKEKDRVFIGNLSEEDQKRVYDLILRFSRRN